MAAVTAALVKELREMTGAGMMDCKKALTATDGDMDKAVDFLREKGLAGAQKKAGRIAAEGIVDTRVSEDGKSAVIVEVNAETDFVAKNEKFRNYVAEVAKQALTTTAADMDAFFAEPWAGDPALTVKEELSSMISVIGESKSQNVVVPAFTASTIFMRLPLRTASVSFLSTCEYGHIPCCIQLLMSCETPLISASPE